jgi:plastocyanin
MSMQHTATPDHNEFDGSGRPGQAQMFFRLFDVAGTVSYHCEIYSFMRGTVIVT